MAVNRERGGLEIGSALKDARGRIGMDIAEAEERTKIRARYIRALEAEDWEVLPAPAYVRGFLRTYGQMLGLDGEMLADEFRRRYEEPVAAASPASEPVLQNRRSVGGRPPSRGPLIAAAVVALLLVLVLLSVLGGDDDAGDGGRDARPGKAKQGKKGGGKDEGSDKLEPIGFSVEPLGSVQICLVGGKDEALIDSQVLSEGSVEEFDGERRYRLDLESGGVVRVEAGKESERLEAGGAASFEADSEGIREIDYAGPDCP
jgi:hypothetical protein